MGHEIDMKFMYLKHYIFGSYHVLAEVTFKAHYIYPLEGSDKKHKRNRENTVEHEGIT